MSYDEALQWFAYLRKRGSIHIGRRIECGIGLLALQQNRQHGGKAELSDFTPHEDQPEASVDDILAAFGVTKNG